jgi:hypothetical protein
MKSLLFISDFLIGLVALGSFLFGLVSHYRSDTDTRDRCIKIFAICVGLLVVMAVVATVLGLPMTGFTFPKQH